MRMKPSDQTADMVGAAMAKSILLCLPLLVVQPFYDERSHHLVAGLAVIAGVLLQALVPPRKKLLLPGLVMAVAFTVVYGFWK